MHEVTIYYFLMMSDLFHLIYSYIIKDENFLRYVVKKERKERGKIIVRENGSYGVECV